MGIIKRYLNYRKNVNRYSTPFMGFLAGFTFIFLFSSVICCVFLSLENDMVYLLLAFLFVGIGLLTILLFLNEFKQEVKSGATL